jgi:hypothetical protein
MLLTWGNLLTKVTLVIARKDNKKSALVCQMKGDATSQRMTSKRDVYSLLYTSIDAIPDVTFDFWLCCYVFWGYSDVQNSDKGRFVDDAADGVGIHQENIVH